MLCDPGLSERESLQIAPQSPCGANHLLKYAVIPPKIQHQLKTKTLISRNLGFRPRDWSIGFVAKLLALWWYLCPELRYGQGSGENHLGRLLPTKQKNESMLLLLLGFCAFVEDSNDSKVVAGIIGATPYRTHIGIAI